MVLTDVLEKGVILFSCEVNRIYNVTPLVKIIINRIAAISGVQH